MKIVSPLPHRRGRLEIIPLIDIMFFLLAAFMVVSIGKIHLKSLKITLPTNVPAAQREPKEDFISISVNAAGQVQLDKESIPNKDALLAKLQALYLQNNDQKFLISADRDARHGDVMDILGRLRSAGFQKVAFSIKNERTPDSVGDVVPASTSPTSSPGAVPEIPTAGAPAAPSTSSAPAPATTPQPPPPAAASPAVPTSQSVGN